MSSTSVTSNTEFNVTSCHSFPSFLLKPQIQSDYFSLIYTHFYFSEDFEECIHEVIRKQVQVIDAKIILHFVFLHSICVACSVSQQNKHFSFCHIWKPAYTIGSGLGAHPKVPQHLRAGHSPRTVAHRLERLVFFLFCELQSGSWDAHSHLLWNIRCIMQYLRSHEKSIWCYQSLSFPLTHNLVLRTVNAHFH